MWVEEVSPTTVEIPRVDDSAPAFVDKSYVCPALLKCSESVPWLYQDGPAYLVFRFRIQEREKKERVYLQPMAIWSDAKKRLVEQVEKINGG